MPTPSGVWLVEDVQPVAAFLDSSAGTGAGLPLRLVDWVPVAPAPPGSPRTVLADGDGFAVQDGDSDSVVRVGADGGVRLHSVPGLTLRAAHDGNVWLTGGAGVAVPRRVRGQPSPPPLPLAENLIVVVRPDGSRQQFTVDHPVTDITADARGLVVTVSEQPISVDGPDHTSYCYPTCTVLLGWDDRSTRIRIDDLAAIPAPPRPRRHWNWHDGDPTSVRASAVDGLGLLWSAGKVFTGSAPDRDVLVTGHSPTTLAEQVRVNLGIVDIVDVAVVGAEMWFAVRRGRSVDSHQPVQVVAVTAVGETRIVLDGDSVDITHRCRPLIAQDEDTRIGHPRREQQKLANLQSFWERPDGTTTPLAEGVSDSATAVRGTWPDTVLEITCRHPSRPGLLLRRRIGLFDEFGRPSSPGYPAVYLMEDLVTGRLPPVDDACDGILDV